MTLDEARQLDAADPLAFAREHSIDPEKSILVGTSTAHRTLAKTLAARYVEMGSRPDSG